MSGHAAARSDLAALAARLGEVVRGEVRFDAGSRALYATDASNYRQVPLGVVIPACIDDVVATVAACREHDAPVLCRGGGTSLAGQCCNVAVVIDMSKHLDAIVELDAHAQRARVQPGVVLDRLRDAAEQHHLTFAPDPATHDHNTLGGMIGNNSCGVHAVMAGRTSDNVESLEVLTYDGLRLQVGRTSDDELERIIAAGGRRGEIYAGLRALRDKYADRIRERFPPIPRRVSGYNLDDLLPENGFHVARALVGSECTCVTVLEATVELVPSPPARTLLVLGFPDVAAAGDRVPEIMAYGPTALEGLDDRLVEDMKKANIHPRDTALLPDGRGWLLVELGGETTQEADAKAREIMSALRRGGDAPSMRLFDDRAQEQKVWEVRESGLGATAHVPDQPITWPGWEDSAVPPDRVGDYLRALRGLLDRHGYACDLYGHFGQGCIHTRIDFDLRSAPGIEKYRAFAHAAAELVVEFGGSLSGEHGDGQSRGELLPIMFGDDLVDAFREFKRIWDPGNRMNPGKVVDADPLDANLRLGSAYAPPAVKTWFHYPDDGGSFSRAMLRCVGVGKCRRHGGGTMCPSFMATHEEKHSTRGRARLLFEMLEGSALTGGWRSEPVREALDLCLSCKGCKSDCPVNVDMATYKAEFLAHHYARRLRPRSAYAFGLIDVWSRLAMRAPSLVNFLTSRPPLSGVAKRMTGMAPAREVPRYARQSFRDWFRRRRPLEPASVMLWPDTFNNYFHPETAIAAVEILEAAGHRVTIPSRLACCGRPLYEYGMLDRARRQLERVLDVLRPALEEGLPVVCLEPSCASVFRDELPNLFANDETARRLCGQTFLLSEFLAEKGESLKADLQHRRALVHGHCHHKAVMGMEAECRVLERSGVAFDVLDSGCCGMAGAFGFEKDKYDVSVKIGERVLLPAVRSADRETLILADGFSCREQIRQLTGRRALHLADVLREGI